MSQRKLNSDVSGASAVEFAVVMPVLLLFLLGILAYGLYVGTTHSVAQLAADAARASVAGLTDAERSEIAHAVVKNTAGNYPLLEPARVTMTAAPAESDATEFKVIVTYDASGLPVWTLGDLLPLPSKSIVRTAVIKRGGY